MLPINIWHNRSWRQSWINGILCNVSLLNTYCISLLHTIHHYIGLTFSISPAIAILSLKVLLEKTSFCISGIKMNIYSQLPLVFDTFIIVLHSMTQEALWFGSTTTQIAMRSQVLSVTAEAVLNPILPVLTLTSLPSCSGSLTTLKVSIGSLMILIFGVSFYHRVILHRLISQTSLFLILQI